MREDVSREDVFRLASLFDAAICFCIRSLFSSLIFLAISSNSSSSLDSDSDDDSDSDELDSLSSCGAGRRVGGGFVGPLGLAAGVVECGDLNEADLTASDFCAAPSFSPMSASFPSAFMSSAKMSMP